MFVLTNTSPRHFYPSVPKPTPPPHPLHTHKYSKTYSKSMFLDWIDHFQWNLHDFSQIFTKKNAKVHFLLFYLIFNQGVQLYTTKVNKQSKLTIFGQCCYQKASPPAFCLIKSKFCAKNRQDFKKMHQHYAKSIKIHTNPYLGLKKALNYSKVTQKH